MNEILEIINLQDIQELENLRLIDLQPFRAPHHDSVNITANNSTNNNTSILLKRLKRSLYTSFRSEKAIALQFRTLFHLLEGKSFATVGYTSNNIDLILTSLEINLNSIF